MSESLACRGEPQYRTDLFHLLFRSVGLTTILEGGEGDLQLDEDEGLEIEAGINCQRMRHI